MSESKKGNQFSQSRWQVLSPDKKEEVSQPRPTDPFSCTLSPLSSSKPSPQNEAIPSSQSSISAWSPSRQTGSAPNKLSSPPRPPVPPRLETSPPPRPPAPPRPETYPPPEAALSPPSPETPLAQALSNTLDAPNSLDMENAQVNSSSYGKEEAEHLGLRLGNIELKALLGEGGMGKVYLAEHVELKTPYAVKVLHPHMSSDELVAERFRREAATASRLRHPNIVFITDFGFNQEVGLYITMEFMKGQDLGESLREHEGGMGLYESIQIIEQVCDALALAHSQGVVHRDLKPDNIFLVEHPTQRNLVKVLDFGIARMLQDEAARLTMDGHVLGTPAYMAPEQVTGESITEKVDIYALGTLMYELIAGETPFFASSHLEFFSLHLLNAPPPISKFRPELANTQLESLLLQTLAKEPSDRPDSLIEIQQRLPLLLRELQSLEIPDAIEPKQSSIVGSPIDAPAEQCSSTQLLKMLQSIVSHPEPTMLGTLYEALPHLASLPLPLFFSASWNGLSWELSYQDLDSSSFELSLSFFKEVLNLLFAEMKDATNPEEVTALVAHALEPLFLFTDKVRQREIINAIQPLLTHTYFPHEVLPRWAQPQTDGTWSRLRSVLNTDVRELLQRPTQGDEDSPMEEGSPSAPDTLDSNSEETLVEKLQREASFENFRSLLSHEIHLFKKKNKS